MSVSVRPLLAPGVAMVTAGAIALGPMAVAPPTQMAAPAVSVPTVHVENIALTGIGQDIYYAITPWVQYGVSLVSYGVGFIPFIGPPIADQIDINYFVGIQPFVEATVNYAAGVVQNPLNFFNTTIAYGDALIDIGVNYINAQLGFIGFPPLPPFPFAATASAARSAAPAAATGPGDVPAALAPALRGAGQRPTVVRDAARTLIEARIQAGGEVRDAVRSARGEVRQAVKDALDGVQKAAVTGSPVDVRQAVRGGTSEVRSAVEETRAEIRTAKTPRGEVRTAAREARASVRASHDEAKDAAK